MVGEVSVLHVPSLHDGGRGVCAACLLLMMVGEVYVLHVLLLLMMVGEVYAPHGPQP